MARKRPSATGQLFETDAGKEFLGAVLEAAAESFRCDGRALIAFVDGMPPTPAPLESVANPACREMVRVGGKLVTVSAFIDDCLRVGSGGRSGECLDVQKLRTAVLAYKGTTARRDRAIDAFGALQTACLAAIAPKGHA